MTVAVPPVAVVTVTGTPADVMDVTTGAPSKMITLVLVNGPPATMIGVAGLPAGREGGSTAVMTGVIKVALKLLPLRLPDVTVT